MDRDSVLGEAVADCVDSQIADAQPLSGGDMAASYRLTLDDGRVIFAKTHANPPEHFFDTEARGLRWLGETQAVPVPQVLGVRDDPPLLVLQWIEEGRRAPADSGIFGAHLAALHSSGAACFGRQDRRTTGSRGLPNEPCDTWVEFFATQRLLPLTRLALDTGTYEAADAAVFEAVASRLSLLGGDPESPARLHGDLWAGNRIVDHSGVSWLIDPACHGGHREFDLAMMRLFGGFSDAEFEAYNEATRLADGWHERVNLHQLAPLLVHAIKFGGSYVPAALTSARHYL